MIGERPVAKFSETTAVGDAADLSDAYANRAFQFGILGDIHHIFPIVPSIWRAVMNREKHRTPEEAKKHLDELLDEALEETFPASDPPAVTPPDDQEPRSPEADSSTVRVRP